MKKFLLTLLLILVISNKLTIYASKDDCTFIYLPILMYHQISNDKSKLSEYVISEEEFENDLKEIKKHGYATITINDLIEYTANQRKLPEKPIMLTFDDGFETDYVYAFPLLKKYNEKAVFSIIGKYADLYSGDVKKDLSYSHLSWEQIKEMSESGHAEFHNHSYDMHNIKNRRGALKKKDESFVDYEKAISKDLNTLNNELINRLGMTSKAFTCPYGFYNDNLKTALKKSGYLAILTSNQRINTITGDPEELYKLNRFVRSHKLDITSLINSWEMAQIPTKK